MAGETEACNGTTTEEATLCSSSLCLVTQDLDAGHKLGFAPGMLWGCLLPCRASLFPRSYAKIPDFLGLTLRR